MLLHLNGKGSALCREWVKAGVGFEVVRTWTPGPFETAAQLERKLKDRKRASDFCPLCTKPAPAPADTELVTI